MVFESIVANILNRYLSDIIEDLDTSNLGISVFGGDINLSNLRIKSTAFEKYDIPIQVVHGYLGSLRIKVPWKNLYNDQTELEIEDLFIRARFLNDVPYDEAKEKNYEKLKIKEKLDLYEQVDLTNFNKDTDQQENVSMVEKIAAHIIKNLKVNIKRILILFENENKFLKHKFILGFKLDSLSIETTDNNFKKTLVKEISTIIHKILEVNDISIIWKDGFTNDSFKTWMDECKSLFVTDNNQQCKIYDYFIKPITMSAKLCMNLKPQKKSYNSYDIFKFGLS